LDADRRALSPTGTDSSYWETDMAINLDDITSTMGANATKQEDNLKGIISSADPNKPQDMIAMQRAMQKWQMSMQVQSQMVNTLGETVKGIIQKMA
jgi:type III secretion apparatus needle protein